MATTALLELNHLINFHALTELGQMVLLIYNQFHNVNLVQKDMLALLALTL